MVIHNVSKLKTPYGTYTVSNRYSSARHEKISTAALKQAENLSRNSKYFQNTRKKGKVLRHQPGRLAGTGRKRDRGKKGEKENGREGERKNTPAPLAQGPRTSMRGVRRASDRIELST